MATRIKITTTELKEQAGRMDALNARLDDVYSQMEGALKKIDNSTCAKFSSNLIVKTASLRRKVQNARNYLLIGAAIAKKCAESYTNADTVIRNNIVDINTPEVRNAKPSTQKVQRYDDETLNAVEGKEQVSDKCTSCALTTLLRRRQVVDGKEVTISYEQVRKYVNNSFKWVNKETEAIPYSTNYITKSGILKSHDSVQEYVLDMLGEHPEGVEIYCKYGSSGKHAIVISDYEVLDNGKIQFYAYDPANGTSRIPLEQTWLCKQYGANVDKMFNSLTNLLYIE